MDTFEYKPTQLAAHAISASPSSKNLPTASKFRFGQHGHTGTWVSNLFPHTAKHVDKFCFLRGLHTDIPAHPGAVIQLHTGAALSGLTRPSIGAWLLYGLGTENQDLPGYVTVNPSPNFGGAINYGSAFLPAHYQGTRISDNGDMPNLRAQTAAPLQRRQLDLIQSMNRDLAAAPGAKTIDGVIQSYELAFRMQDRVPAAPRSFARNRTEILDEYGFAPARKATSPGGLMARPNEAGVRLVEDYAIEQDHHSNLHQGLISQSAMVDQPTAALLNDLERRGLLDDTLVLFGSED